MIIDHPDTHHIPALRTLWKQAFGDTDGFLDSFFAHAFSYDRCRCLLIQGQPVAAVYLFDCRWNEKKCAYLYALAVEQTHRGQGFSRLLLTDTHAFLRRQGYAGAIMEPATPALQAYYEKLGYVPFGGRQEITVAAAPDPIPAQPCGALAYARARAALLPAGGVVQEGAVLDLLQDQGQLLCGADFAAVAMPEEGTIPEFLGDRRKLPGLLAGLGMENARVRLPGTENQSLYLSLDGTSPTPTYFGLPLD